MVYSDKVTTSVKETLREESSIQVSSQDDRTFMLSFVTQRSWCKQTLLSGDRADLTT